MKLAICNETFVDWPHDRAFAFARECGYTGIEIAPFTLAADATAVTGPKRRELAALARRHGLEVVGLHWVLAKTEGYHVTCADEAIRRRTADYFARLAELCRDLGGSLLVFGSPLQRNRDPEMSIETAWANAREVFERALPALERHEVTLCLEPLGPAETNFLNTAAEAARMIEELASPWCRLHLDAKAMSTENQPIPRIIEEHAARLHHFHANDPNRQGPGFGDLDFRPILETLARIDYRGWISVEVFDYAPGPERLASESAEYLRRCAVQEPA